MFRGYLVCYDIRDDKRLRRVHKALKGFGEAWQYSVFFCYLKDVDRVKLQRELEKEINSKEDEVLILDLGPDEGAVMESVTCLGPRIPGRVRVLVV